MRAPHIECRWGKRILDIQRKGFADIGFNGGIPEGLGHRVKEDIFRSYGVERHYTQSQEEIHSY
jgi:hypothetical protein